MPEIKAKQIEVKLYVRRGNVADGFASIYAQMSPDERLAADGVESTIDALNALHGYDFMKMLPGGNRYFLHPTISDANNAVFVNKYAKGQTPTLEIVATYADGSRGRYILYPGFSDKFTGVNWTADDLLPYFKALIYQTKPGERSLICKLIPALCDWPAWAWFAAAVYATKETIDAKDRPLAQIFYGLSAFAAWEALGKKGGLKSVGIGKRGPVKLRVLRKEGGYATATERKAIAQMIELGMTEGQTSKNKQYKIVSIESGIVKAIVYDRYISTVGADPTWHKHTLLFEII